MRKVEILMSTYNGEKFVEAQIKSIVQQKNVDIHLTIRDDGSKDDTISIIKMQQKKYPDRIALVEGENVGYRKSFLRLLDFAIDADYYGFADQDDLWKEEKISRAVECLENAEKPICLYVGSLEIVDSNLQEIDAKDISSIPNTLGSLFTRNRFAGCTFLFSRTCKELAQKFSKLNYPQNQMSDHDFLVAACAYSCGTVILDSQKNILHIRHSSSVTSGGNGLKKRFQTEWNYVFNRRNVQSTLAKELLEKCSDKMPIGKEQLLSEIASYQHNPRTKLRLLFDSDMNCGTFVCNLECKLKVLLNSY